MNRELKMRLAVCGRPAWRVARECGLSAFQLTRITTGQRVARPEERAALARALECAEDAIFPTGDELQAA